MGAYGCLTIDLYQRPGSARDSHAPLIQRNELPGCAGMVSTVSPLAGGPQMNHY
jgi:hypothetical protein